MDLDLSIKAFEIFTLIQASGSSLRIMVGFGLEPNDWIEERVAKRINIPDERIQLPAARHKIEFTVEHCPGNSDDCSPYLLLIIRIAHIGSRAHPFPCVKSRLILRASDHLCTSVGPS